MMQDWNNYRESLLERVKDYATQSPDTVHGLMVIDHAAAKTGHLEPKIHELIALAVAVTTAVTVAFRSTPKCRWERRYQGGNI